MRQITNILLALGLILLPQLNGFAQEESYSFSIGRKPTETEALQTAIHESGLYKLTHEQSDTISLADMLNFFQEVILRKYEGSEHQEGLKYTFIIYTVNGFNLRHKENDDATQQLIYYTREFISLKHYFDFAFSFNCLTSIKSMLSKEECDELVKTERLKIGLLSAEWQARQKTVNEKKKVNFGLDSFIKSLSRIDSDFAALVTK